MAGFCNVLAMGNSLMEILSVPPEKHLSVVDSSLIANETVQKVAAHGYHVLFLTGTTKNLILTIREGQRMGSRKQFSQSVRRDDQS